ncbi:extracellular solute-binding protein, partial [Paenibacillus sepulcri]|nr:extracellular solute-binding protein [Paenibacillus sepulcri]
MNTKMWKLLKLPLVVALGTTLLAGCGNANQPSSSSNAENGAPSPETTAKTPTEETVEISFMNLWAKDNTENVATSVREALAKFQEENPGIVIKEEAIGDQNAYYTKLKTLAASNDLPDIFISKGSELAMFAANGAAAPLDEILEADAGWKDGFLPSSFNDLSSGGQTYGIPFSMLATSVVYYNKQILADAGYDTFPATWNEFVDAIGKIKAKGIVPIALGNKEQWVAESCILSALGDRFTGPEWFASINEKTGAKFTDGAFVQSLTAFQSLAQMGAFNSDLNSINNDQQKTIYFNGKAAMFIEGSWAIGAVASAPPEIASNTDVAVLPAVDGGQGNPLATSGGA